MRKAFSLVELSIVLVILGLLTGGILAGQSLIRASELRSVSSDYQRYKTAFGAFRDKYFAVPGDMANATTFWGIAGGDGSCGDSACYQAVHTGTATCNGDGTGNMNVAFCSNEAVHFWQHLSNAGLIEGLTGGRATFAGYSTYLVIGYNMPPSKVSTSVGWGTWTPVPLAGSTSTFAAPDQGNILALRTASNTLTMSQGAAILKPEEAWNIDSKLDDGMPGTGIMMATKGDGATTFCTTAAGSAVDAGATYKLDNTSPDCGIKFLRVY